MAASHLCRFTAVAVFLVAGTIPARAAESSATGATGDMWDVTTQMTMEGMEGMPEGMPAMAMPPMKLKACAKRNEPPAPVDERRRCRRTDSSMSGNTYRWKEICAGPPESTGEGTITRSGNDAFTGTIKYTSSEGNMKMNLSGRRVGTCTPQ